MVSCLLWLLLLASRLCNCLTPVQWLNARHTAPCIPCGSDDEVQIQAVEYTVIATWDENRKYKTHVTARESSLVSKDPRYTQYEIRLGYYRTDNGRYKASLVYLKYYRDVAENKDMRNIKEADLNWVGANTGDDIDIYYIEDGNPPLRRNNVKKRGTFIVKAFEQILAELGVNLSKNSVVLD